MVLPRKNGYRFVALLPDIDYNNSNEYDNIKQESARCGFKFDEKYPLYFRVTVKDEKTQNDALDFATLIYKVWDEYMSAVQKVRRIHLKLKSSLISPPKIQKEVTF